MLGNFSKAYSQAATSRGIFQSGNFPNVQFPKRQLPKFVLAATLDPQSVIAAELGPHCSLRLARSLTSCLLGNYPFRKLPLGKSPFGKIPSTFESSSYWVLDSNSTVSQQKSLYNLEFEVSQCLRLWFFPTNPLLLFCSPWYIHVNI